jgi:hypothetical protein
MADFNSQDLASANFSPISNTIPSPVPAADTVQVRPILYRMRGYYVAGSTYEFWVTRDPLGTNPSGNPLVNKVIDAVLRA